MTTSRTVLVTGGNRGIGYAIATEFLAQGHRVAVTARSGEGPAGSLTVRADVTDADSIDRAFTEIEAELGPVEVVVANAGITRDTLLMRMSEDEFTSVIDTNLTGAFRVVKRASKGMLKARFGRIVLISSVVGLFGSAGQVNYSSSKAGLVGMARSLTRELGARNITTNVVAPGFIETDMTGELSEAQQAEYKKSIPLGRYASPDRGRTCRHLARGRRRELHLGRRHPGRRRPRHGALAPESFNRAVTDRCAPPSTWCRASEGCRSGRSGGTGCHRTSRSVVGTWKSVSVSCSTNSPLVPAASRRKTATVFIWFCTT